MVRGVGHKHTLGEASVLTKSGGVEGGEKRKDTTRRVGPVRVNRDHRMQLSAGKVLGCVP